MSYLEKAKDIYSQLQQGKLLDAFDQYYHDDVVMTEPKGGTRKGKKDCRDYEEKFLSNVKEFHNLEIRNVGSNENEKSTFVESMMDATLQDGKRYQMEQTAVQQWAGDHIIYERFYYDKAIWPDLK